MKILCRACRVELTPINQHSHGFCIECTGDNISTAKMLDEQYTRMAQDTSLRTWDLLNSLSDEVHATRVEMRILLEELGLIRAKRKRKKKVTR